MVVVANIYQACIIKFSILTSILHILSHTELPKSHEVDTINCPHFADDETEEQGE